MPKSRNAVSALVLQLTSQSVHRHRFYSALALVTIASFLAVGGLAVLAWGGTAFVGVHLMYVPVVLAAFLFGLRGGVATALLAGLIVGPLMPLAVESGSGQTTAAWLTRTLFFMFAGMLVGTLSTLLKQRIELIERLLDETSQTYSQTLRTFAAVVATRDEQTAGHCERVAHNAVAVAEELGLSIEEVEVIYWAGLLHDLGKIGVPEAILLKEDKLTDTEYALVKRHATLGASLILGVSGLFRPIADGIRTHHETWEGSGYPSQLAREEIPLTGRILSVVDVFEALTSLRPYREAQHVDFALDFLREHAGTRFDPRVVEAFEAVFQRGGVVLYGDPATGLQDGPARSLRFEHIQLVAAA